VRGRQGLRALRDARGLQRARQGTAARRAARLRAVALVRLAGLELKRRQAASNGRRDVPRRLPRLRAPRMRASGR